MSDFLPVTIDSFTINIEAEPTYGSEQTTSLEEVQKQAQGVLEDTRATIVTMARTMVSAIRMLGQAAKPEEFIMEFAIKFTAEGNVIVARAGAEANLKITLKYTKDQTSPDDINLLSNE